jgi:stalled ribosome rescue protein Dom34
MTHAHAVVWIDHREAHVIRFGATGSERKVIHSKHEPQQLYHKANSIGSGRAALDKQFFNNVTAAIADASAVVITGPASAKTELVNYIHAHKPTLSKAIRSVETLDHPSEGELLNFARKYFESADRLVQK